MMPGSVEAWPASQMMSSRARGQAPFSFQAASSGVTTSKRPWAIQPGMPCSRCALFSSQPSSSKKPRFWKKWHSMRAMAGRFEMHAQTVSDEARKMWASSQNIAGSGWSGTAQMSSYDTMGQMNQAFTNIVNMLHGVRDGLIRDANNYETQEQASQQILSS